MRPLQWNDFCYFRLIYFENKYIDAMNQLTARTCVACSLDSRLATPEEINVFMQQLPNWVIVE
jgi:hypothetical protein